jgi:3-ketoacyl-CoA synthase
VLVSNQAQYRRTAKYQLLHNVRVHTGQDDSSYSCMGWGPDKEGVNGVFLRKDVPLQAAKALEACLRTVTPRIMTWGQYAEAAYNMFESAVLGRTVPDYVPDFTKCVDHFALHAGGYAVLKGLQQAMRLPAAKMLPSFGTLRDYGNTSCSTTWYVMAYMETCEDVRRGQVIMQIGMGGGMKVGGLGRGPGLGLGLGLGLEKASRLLAPCTGQAAAENSATTTGQPRCDSSDCYG